MKSGKAIRILREARCMSQSTLAKKAGTSAGFLSLVESGERGASVQTLVRIAAALDIPLDALIVLLAEEANLTVPDWSWEIVQRVRAFDEAERELASILDT